MAEALFNKKVKESTILNGACMAVSVGFFVDPADKNVSSNSQKVMKEIYDIDISSHIPTQITKEDVDEADLILCMDRFKAEYAICKYLPENPEKIVSIKEYVDLSGAVVDPFGGDYDTYKACAEEIEMLIDLLIKKEEKLKEEE